MIKPSLHDNVPNRHVSTMKQWIEGKLGLCDSCICLLRTMIGVIPYLLVSGNTRAWSCALWLVKSRNRNCISSNQCLLVGLFWLWHYCTCPLHSHACRNSLWSLNAVEQVIMAWIMPNGSWYQRTAYGDDGVIIITKIGVGHPRVQRKTVGKGSFIYEYITWVLTNFQLLHDLPPIW